MLRAKDQGWTKDEPKNAEIENVRFIKIAVSFTSLIPCLILPTDDRENSERRAHQLPTIQKCYLLRSPIFLNAKQSAICAVLKTKNRPKIDFSCSYQNISVPLHPNLRWREICPTKSVSYWFLLRVGFWHIDSVYWRFAFGDSKTSQLFNYTSNQSNSKCLWVWLYPCYISFGCGVFSYQRRFPVVYWSVKAMRRPRVTNKQLEVCAFLYVNMWTTENETLETGVITSHESLM